MFDPYVYIHFVRENRLRNTEVIMPIQYPDDLTSIIEIQNYGFKWADENPMPGWVVKIVKVKVKARMPRELLR